MKFFNLLFLPVIGFSFQLEFTKEFTHQLPHDTLIANVMITIEDESESIVNDRFKVFNNKIKNFDIVERELEKFNIRPKYRHISSTPKITGYIGELRYKVNSYKAKDMHMFISELTELKRFRDTTVSVSNLSWSVKEETYNVTLDLLRFEAISWGNTYANNLSNDLKKNCVLEKVKIDRDKINDNSNVNILYSNTLNNSKDVDVPDAKEERVTIYPKYFLECK
ncbi:hypothetical protein [Halarcobacter sp.]|uniref:SIMPL domain-containing protein n=1 Tax=Halarcobacter sp. TaxID=2321133 RepID=UPI002AABD307|nr:hypothetical protein [Halarcobacter sp.]